LQERENWGKNENLVLSMEDRMNRKQFSTMAIGALLGWAAVADGAGFFLIEQSVSSMGNAYAGAAAEGPDASILWFNPAGNTRICGTQIVAGGHVVLPSVKFDNDDSLYKPLGVPGGGTLLQGGNGHNAGEPALVGNFYASRQINNCLWAGLAVTSPFGLVTDYGHEWAGRYYAIRSAVLTININPSIAYKINECWSVGVGVSAMYLHAKLTNAIDFGYVLGNTPPFGIGQVTNPALWQNVDGKAIVKGNSWGWGGNVGILWEPCCGTRFGLSYRSEVKHKVKGSAKFKDEPAPLSGVFQNQRVHANVTLPSITSFSAYHELNSCWAVLGDITWFQWKVIRGLTFYFSRPVPPLLNEAQTTTLKWQNTFRYSLGATYRPNCCWAIRVGAAYDQTPVKNKELTTPRVPDADRIWAAIGAHYNWSDCLGFDVGYAHIFAKKSKIDKRDSFGIGGEDFGKGALIGDWDSRTDIVSAQVVVSF
jgi:long-chain fatty acid transport protein